MKIQYKARKGTRLTDADAQEIATFFNDTEKPFKPQVLVDAAKPKKSKFHHLFEWDNDKAADEFRLSQARRYIGAVIVIVDEKPPTRAFFNVRTEEDQGYLSLDNITESTDYVEQLMDQCWRDLNLWRLKYGALEIFSPVFKAITEVEGVYNGKKEKRRSVRSRSTKAANRTVRRYIGRGHTPVSQQV